MNSATWKWIATALAAVVLSLSAEWLMLNARAVTKAQVEDMIKPDAQTLQHTYEELRELRKQVEQLDREVGEIRGLLSGKR